MRRLRKGACTRISLGCCAVCPDPNSKRLGETETETDRQTERERERERECELFYMAYLRAVAAGPCNVNCKVATVSTQSFPTWRRRRGNAMLSPESFSGSTITMQIEFNNQSMAIGWKSMRQRHTDRRIWLNLLLQCFLCTFP